MTSPDPIQPVPKLRGLETLRQRRDYLTLRIEAKAKMQWENDYDRRERDALSEVIAYLEAHHPPLPERAREALEALTCVHGRPFEGPCPECVDSFALAK
jgi:hypothetical protein